MSSVLPRYRTLRPWRKQNCLKNPIVVFRLTMETQPPLQVQVIGFEPWLEIHNYQGAILLWNTLEELLAKYTVAQRVALHDDCMLQKRLKLTTTRASPPAIPPINPHLCLIIRKAKN